MTYATGDTWPGGQEPQNSLHIFTSSRVVIRISFPAFLVGLLRSWAIIMVSRCGSMAVRTLGGEGAWIQTLVCWVVAAIFASLCSGAETMWVITLAARVMSGHSRLFDDKAGVVGLGHVGIPGLQEVMWEIGGPTGRGSPSSRPASPC